MGRRVDAEGDTGTPVLPSIKETTVGVRASFVVDQLDSAWFPRKGYRVITSAYAADQAFGSSRNYQRVEGQIMGAKSCGAHTVQLVLGGGTDLNSDMPAYESFTLGGPLRLSGYRINEFAGRRMAFGRAMYYNRAFPLPELFGSGAYIGGSLEAGQIHNRFDGLPYGGTKWSGSVFLAADTVAGPAFFGFGIGEAGRMSLYLLLGAP